MGHSHLCCSVVHIGVISIRPAADSACREHQLKVVHAALFSIDGIDHSGRSSVSLVHWYKRSGAGVIWEAGWLITCHRKNWRRKGFQKDELGRLRILKYEIGWLRVWKTEIRWLRVCDRVQDSFEEQEFWMTRLDRVGIRLNQFEMCDTHENCLSRWKQCCSSWKQCWMKTMYK